MLIKRILAITVLLALGVQLVPRSAGATKLEVKACLAALEASYSLAKQQKLLEQREQLLHCSEPQCPSDVRNDCVQKVEEVNRAIPTIIFHVTDPAGNDLSDVRVTMDAEPFVSQLIGAAIPLNPGKHEFVFEVEGQVPVQKALIIQRAQRDRLVDVTVRSVVNQHSSTSIRQRLSAWARPAEPLVPFLVLAAISVGVAALPDMNLAAASRQAEPLLLPLVLAALQREVADPQTFVTPRVVRQ